MSCSSDDQSDKECPLCMEALEIDDWNFYPCKCEYQICRFCWHRLRTDENGLCPACRQPYPEEPLNFKPLSTADMAKMKSEKKMKQQAEKQRISESRKHLASYRVLQKNLVYVIGLSARVADPEMLRKAEYFGKYGKITKVAVGTTTAGVVGSASHTAYVTYLKVEEALRAIQGVQNALVDGRVVKASLGTTKYCSSFLRSQACYKPECMYLHDMADADISFTKEDMHAGKHAEYEKRLMDLLLKTPSSNIIPCVPPQPLISSAVSSTLAAAANAKMNMKKIAEMNGTNGKESKSSAIIVEEKKVREEEKKKELLCFEEDPPLIHSSTLIESNSNVSSIPLVTPSPVIKPNAKSKNKLEEKTNGITVCNLRASTQKKDKKASQPTPIIRDLSILPPELSASPPDDWTSRDDGPSCSPPPGIPSITGPPPGLDHTISSTTMTPPSESSISPPRENDASSVSISSHMDMERPLTPPSALPEWQTLLGLAPVSNRRPITPPMASNGFFSDDDLGFDPFHESSRELAAMVEEEKKRIESIPPPPHLHSLNHPMASAFGFAGMDGLGHGSMLNGSSMMAPPSSLPMSSYGQDVLSCISVSSSLSHRPRDGLSSHGYDGSPLDGLGNGSSSLNPFGYLSSCTHSTRFTSSLDPFSSLDSHGHYGRSSSRLQSSYDNGSSSLFAPPGLGLPMGMNMAPPPPGLGPPRNGGGPHIRSTQSSSSTTTCSSNRQPIMSMAEWQEGLKSLLPNVNVRFAPELER